jgi:hypothetical protein
VIQRAMLGAALFFTNLTPSSAFGQTEISFTAAGQSRPSVVGTVRPTREASAEHESCTGRIEGPPTAEVVVEGSLPWLRIFAESETDTTLVLRTADGRVFCNDDSFGHHPAIQTALPAGRHKVWVGSYADMEEFEFELTTTRSATEWPTGFWESNLERCGQGDDGSRTCLQPDDQRANFGCAGQECVFNANERPSLNVPVTAGGGSNPVPVAQLALRDFETGGACGQAHVTSRPDARVWVRDPGEFLRFFVRTRIDNDATILLLGPDGRWRCNDDAFDRMPGVDILSPTAGRYDIWVGTYDGSRSKPGILVVTRDQALRASPL